MNLRRRHLAAYASAMLALMVWQIFFYTDPFSTLSDFHTDILYTLVSQIFCMGIVPFVVLTVLSKGRVAENFRIMRYKPPRDNRSCLLICLALMCLITPFTMVFNAVTNIVFNIIGFKRAHPIGTVYLGVGDFFLMLFMTAVLPAVFEEFSHRGVLLSGLQNHGSEMGAVVFSALFFGLMHANPAQFIYAVAGGLVFGAFVVKTDSILPAMCAHFANNAVSVILDYSVQRQTALGRFYETMTSSGGILSLGLTLSVLAFAVFGIVMLLKYAARKAPKPVVQGKLLGVVTLDKYCADGRSTLRDNVFLIATGVAQTALLLFLVFWGIIR